jgi:alginate O-acetyltransferase complex protein AlgI
MSYTIDVWRGRVRALPSFTDFACYVSMFPQLVAGPIVRFRDVEAQLRSRTHDLAKFSRGAACVCAGLGKKVLLANPLAEAADACFAAAGPGALEAWWGLFAYAFQIYFDFSGYSDMAIGLGLMLGFTFPQNFDAPYRAESLTEFWRRWHISLSGWLRDYLYVPLGGNRLGERRTYVNLVIVMLLGGLWHGAAWHFVAWGAWHGAWLAVERALGRRALWSALPRPLRIACTFVAVCAGWVLFRAESFGHAGRYLAALAGVGGGGGGPAFAAAVAMAPLPATAMAAAATVTWAAPRTWEWTADPAAWKTAVALALLLASLAALTVQAHNPFIYFIF